MESFDKPQGEIITFYSYKGEQAGQWLEQRCLSACQGQSQGKGVLMIDWILKLRACISIFMTNSHGLAGQSLRKNPAH